MTSKNILAFFNILKIVNKANYTIFALTNFYNYGCRRKQSNASRRK